VYPRNWNLTFIGLPKVNKRKQHCPTLTADEITHLVASAKGRYRVAAALLAGSNIRISELLALRVEKHISDDRSTLFIRQQRRKRGGDVTNTLKTPAADRNIDLYSALAKMLDDYIGDGKDGFLFETVNGKMQLVEDVKYRKQWAEKVGLGFELPEASELLLDVSCATSPVRHDCSVNA
jgi:integrase